MYFALINKGPVKVVLRGWGGNITGRRRLIFASSVHRINEKFIQELQFLTAFIKTFNELSFEHDEKYFTILPLNKITSDSKVAVKSLCLSNKTQFDVCSNCRKFDRAHGSFYG